MNKLLEVHDLETQFSTSEGTVHAVNGVSFNLKEGETLGIVGESGSGKSVTVMSVLKLIPSPPGKIVNGQVLFEGQDLLKLSDKKLQQIRGAEISMIFQDPMTSFNPVLSIGKQISEPLMIHKSVNQEEATHLAEEMLRLTGIPKAKERMNDYPHQFSGGMRQRAMIAMSLVCNPKILIADEPTTALDVTIQAQIIELIKKLRDEMEMAIIWITHDLGIIAGLADRVIVMYCGFIIEEASVSSLYSNPAHPYTLGLLGSLPRLDQEEHRRLIAIRGLPPVQLTKPISCPFLNRCDYSIDICSQVNPSLIEVDTNHYSACWVDVKTRRVRK